MEHLFVYGTLRRELHHPLHSVLLRHSVYRGRATLAGELYDLGSYPGAIRCSDPRRSIIGELYRLTSLAVLEALDEYEGHDIRDPTSSLFHRYEVDVRPDDGGCARAWAYLYNRPIAGRPRIRSGDYLCFLRGKARKMT